MYVIFKASSQRRESKLYGAFGLHGELVTLTSTLFKGQQYMHACNFVCETSFHNYLITSS